MIITIILIAILVYLLIGITFTSIILCGDITWNIIDFWMCILLWWFVIIYSAVNERKLIKEIKEANKKK